MGLFIFINIIFAVSISQAYLDPGSGSLFFQGIIVALIGGFYFVKSKFLALTKKKTPEQNIPLDQVTEKPIEVSNSHGN